MAIVHANQSGAVHNIEPGTIGDKEVSSGDPIDALTKIKNLDKAAKGLVGPAGPAGAQGPAGPGATLAVNAFVLGTAATAGAATTVPRTDDTIAAFDATAPVTQASGDAAATGTAAFAARRDHRHGMPTIAPLAINALVLGTTAVVGVATTAPRTDDTIAAFDITAPTISAVGDAAAVGTVARAARRDHVHGREAFGIPGSSAVGDTAAAGVATTSTRSDHTHGREAFATNAILLSTAAAAGLATTPMRSNDTIAAFDTVAPTTIAYNDAAAVGIIAFAARRDHRHGMFGALDKVTVDTTVTSTLVETTVYTKNIAGGTIGTNNTLRLTILYEQTVPLLADAVTLTFRFKYGGTTFGAVDLSYLVALAAARSGTINIIVSGNGATNSQLGFMTVLPTGSAADNVVVNPLQVFGTAAIDSTLAQDLVVTIQPNASTNAVFTMDYAILEAALV